MDELIGADTEEQVFYQGPKEALDKLSQEEL